MKHSPSETIIEALADAIRAIVREEMNAGRVGAVTFSQLDGERPVGCGVARYLRVHRLAREAKDPGATTQGRARLMTAEAWGRWCDTRLPRTRVAPPASAPVLSIDDEVIAALGGRRSA